MDPPACALAARQIHDASFGPDHATVVVVTSRGGGEEGSLESDEIWDARAGRFVATLAKDLEHHGGLETGWSADGKRAAIIGVGDSKFGYGLFDTSTWRAIARDVDVSFAFPCDLAVDPKGARVAVATLIGQAWIDDMTTGKSLGTAGTPTNERAAGHVCNPLTWGGDGETILLEGLRRSKGMRPVPRSPGVAEEILQMTPSPAGAGVAFLDLKGTLTVFEKHGSKPVGKPIAVAPDIPAESADRGPVLGFAWTPDASGIATWDALGRVRLWDAKTGSQRKSIQLTVDRLSPGMGPEGEESRLTWSPDGRRFVFDVDATGPELWSLDGVGKRLTTPGDAAPESGAPRAFMSPDGARVLVGTHLFDAKTGALVREVPAYSKWLDGSNYLVLATVYDDTAPLRVMRLSDGAILNIARLGDDDKPVLLPYTEDGVFQGPAALAGCLWLPETPPPAQKKRPSPEPRDTLLADFWAGKPVQRTCPAP